MIRTCAINHDEDELLHDIPVNQLMSKDIKWFWVDYSDPTDSEDLLLSKVFKFHPLAIEDCLDEFSQRPKLDFYDTYLFIVTHALNQSTLESYEVDVFISEKFIVTYHRQPVRELNNLWERIRKGELMFQGPFIVLHAIIDKLVDEYFPPVYQLEDRLNSIEDNTENESIHIMMDRLFDVRSDLSKLRRTILPMRDLLYRIIHSERLSYLKEHKVYFHDVHDHLLKLVEMIESYRDFSSDIRDSYLSVSSNTMNTIMMTLTVITTIFMPLTFIAGIYGMNFRYMPELEWRYGYYLILGVMLIIALVMFFVFRVKGWFRFAKKSGKKRRQIKMR